jgi:hypothetical protein
MSHTSRTTAFVGIAMAAGCLGIAAMLTATTARADDLTDILAGVQNDLLNGQSAFASAAADLSSNNASGALAEFFTGVDQDLIFAPDSLYIGTVQALTGEPISDQLLTSLVPPSDFANGLADADTAFSQGLNLFGDAATDLAGGDYSAAAIEQAIGSFFVSALPVEYLIMGAADQFGL